jgi:hypothetical protein
MFLYRARAAGGGSGGFPSGMTAYDVHCLVSPRSFYVDFDRIEKNRNTSRITFEYDGLRRRIFDIVPEETDLYPMKIDPYIVLCDHSIRESRIIPSHRDRIVVSLRRRERYGRMDHIDDTQNAMMYAIACMRLSNARANPYNITLSNSDNSDVDVVSVSELSPGYLFLLNTSNRLSATIESFDLKPSDDDKDKSSIPYEDVLTIVGRKSYKE